MNATDPNFTGEVDRDFGTLLSELEPRDALVLDTIQKVYGSFMYTPASSFLPLDDEGSGRVTIHPSGNQAQGWAVCKRLGIEVEEWNISAQRLNRLGLICPGVMETKIQLPGGDNVSAIIRAVGGPLSSGRLANLSIPTLDLSFVQITDYGKAFQRAVSDASVDASDDPASG